MNSLTGRTALLLACFGLFGTAATGLFAATTAATPADPAAFAVASGQRGTLLLNNGNLIEGLICRVGDRYQVTVAGGQVDVRTADVRLAAASRDAVYQRLRGTIANDNAVDHLRLAHWCIRWQLLGYAAREILVAQETDPKCPGIDRLKRQLHTAVEAGKVRPANHTTRALAHAATGRRRQRTLRHQRNGRSSGRRASGTQRAAPRHVPATPTTVNWPTTTARWPGSVKKPRGLAPPKAAPVIPRRPDDRAGGSSKPLPSTHRSSVKRAATPHQRDAFDPAIFNASQGESE